MAFRSGHRQERKKMRDEKNNGEQRRVKETEERGEQRDHRTTRQEESLVNRVFWAG